MQSKETVIREGQPAHTGSFGGYRSLNSFIGPANVNVKAFGRAAIAPWFIIKFFSGYIHN